MNARYSETVEHSVEIAAPRERVWRALTDPDCVVVWDVGVVRPLDAPPDYPRPGQVVRWKYNLSGLPLILIDAPQAVTPLETLRTLIKLAFLRFDETYTLRPLPGNAVGTLLSVRLEIGNTLPIGRRVFDRLVGRGLARATIEESLSAIRKFCVGDSAGGAQPQTEEGANA